MSTLSTLIADCAFFTSRVDLDASVEDIKSSYFLLLWAFGYEEWLERYQKTDSSIVEFIHGVVYNIMDTPERRDVENWMFDRGAYEALPCI